MTSRREALVSWLMQLRECTASNLRSGKHQLVYAGIGDFLLQHGTWYENVRVHRHRAEPRMCFRNAFMEAATHRGWKYVEGYSATDLIEVHHAWCLDKDDKPVEVTWPEAGLAYLGVVFPIARVSESNGCVLDPPNRNMQVYMEPWSK